MIDKRTRGYGWLGAVFYRRLLQIPPVCSWQSSRVIAAEWSSTLPNELCLLGRAIITGAWRQVILNARKGRTDITIVCDYPSRDCFKTSTTYDDS